MCESVIAMSGAFSGDEVPSGVVADAFYQKGCGIRSLLRIIGGLDQGEAAACKPADQRGIPLDSTKQDRCRWRTLRFDPLPGLPADFATNRRRFSQPDKRSALRPLREYRLLLNRRARSTGPW
jgi:hypothetical protein